MFWAWGLAVEFRLRFGVWGCCRLLGFELLVEGEGLAHM